jgi:hypothetical protein
MSIATMSNYAELNAGATTRGAAGTNSDDDALKTALARITGYVPTEAVASYVAALGILTPNSSGGRWALFLAIAALAAFLVFYYWKTTAADPKPGKTALYWQLVFALGGLAAWAAALPSSPFLSIHNYSAALGGLIIVIVSPAVPLLANLVHVSPPKT